MSGVECEYDSTWEDEDENKTPKKKKKSTNIKYIANKKEGEYRSHRNMHAARDMQNFRHSCQDLDADARGEQVRFYNLEFYRGQIKSSPDNVHIDEFHTKWWGDYDSLEYVRSYIQWLFPIQEPGVNWSAYVLTKNEIKLFRKDEQVKSKLVQSYKLMLDFYGIRLVNESTGEVARADNWRDRFMNLNRNSHNNLRITRILKCLGTLGLEHYQAPLVKFFLHETLEVKQLQNVKQSVLDYFMFAVLDKSKRQELVKYAFMHFKPQEHFIWGPKKILSRLVENCKQENVNQLENKHSRTAEKEQKNMNPQENKHKINKIDGSHPPAGMDCKKANQNNMSHDGNDDVSDPHQTKKGSSCKMTNKTDGNDDENESVPKINNEMTVGVGDDDVSGPYQTIEMSSCEMSDMSVGDDNGSLLV